MKLITVTALALGTVAAAPALGQDQAYGNAPQQAPTVPDTSTRQPRPAAAPASQEPANQAGSVRPSNKAMKAIVDLQATVKKNDFASIPVKVAAAQAVASTKEDRYLIGQLQLQGALAAKDDAAMASAIDTVAASGFLDPAKVGELYRSLGSTFYNAKQYPQAQAAYQKASTADPSNAQAIGLLGEAYLAQGQKAQAAAAFQRAVQVASAGGQKPDEALLKRAVAVAYDLQSPAATDMARTWVAAYPSATSWSDALAIYSNLSHPDAESALDLYRLRQATGSLRDGREYAQYARTAAELGNFNESQAAFDAGVAAKAINPTDAAYSDLVNGLKAKPKATAADLAVATKTAQSGMALLRIGDRYYAMGDYAKAVELYRMSMGKPGVDASVGNLHIGMALARAGDKAGATTALNAVTGPRADIAKFWLAYLNQRA